MERNVVFVLMIAGMVIEHPLGYSQALDAIEAICFWENLNSKQLC